MILMQMAMEKEKKKAIEKQVYDTYPVTKKEKNCLSEQIKREFQRSALRKRLISEHQGKKQYE